MRLLYFFTLIFFLSCSNNTSQKVGGVDSMQSSDLVITKLDTSKTRVTIQEMPISFFQKDVTALNKKIDSLTKVVQLLQTNIDDVQDIAVKAILEANRKDTLTNAPGEITITKLGDKKFAIGIYNYAQLIRRIEALELKKQ